MRLKDTQGVVGTLVITKTNTITGVIEKFTRPNLVVTDGKDFIASRMVGIADDVMSHMAVGTGATAPISSNASLGTEIARVALASGTATDNTATFTANFPAGTGTGAWTEAGILNGSSGSTMLSRTTFPVVTKGAGDAISISWSVTIN